MQFLTIERIIQILANRGHYGLSKSICEYLNLPVENVVIHWACFKVKAGTEDDDALIRSIFEKMSAYEGISYAPVAKEAYKAGKIDLATKVC